MKKKILKPLQKWRDEESATLVSSLAKLTYKTNAGSGRGSDLQTVLAFLRIYEDKLRLNAFDKLPASEKTLSQFRARYSSLAQADFNRALVREKGRVEVEHFVAQKVDLKQLHCSWRPAGVFDAFRVSLGNLSLVPQKPNIAALNCPPRKKVKYFRIELGGMSESDAQPHAAAPAEAPDEPDRDAAADDDEADEAGAEAEAKKAEHIN